MSRNRIQSKPPRRGMSLAMVLVMVALLSFAAYSFTDIMLAESEVSVMFQRQAQTQAFADSGVELVAAVLGRLDEEAVAVNLYNNPDLFGSVVIKDDAESRGRGLFSVVAAVENDDSFSSSRFGLVDESSKLNLNALLQFEIDDEQRRDMLMVLPEMTMEIADAILDWLDDDEELREYGAENEHYGTLVPPYESKNGMVDSFDELLLVRGITPALLYGEDANRNGKLEANENDGEGSLPLDNSDDILNRGWSAYLTVSSRETNLRQDGTPRIDVNQEDLASLYDAVLADFDEDTARFVTAYRLYGASSTNTEQSGVNRGATPGGNLASPGENTTSTAGGNVGGGGSGTEMGAGEGNRGSGGSVNSGGGQRGRSRGGLNLSAGGQQTITSLYDLIGVTVNAQVNGQEQELQSPWQDNPSSLTGSLPVILDTLATTDQPYLEGRINIAQAPREVLLAIPDIEDQVVEAMIGAQTVEANTDADPNRATSAWLLLDGVVQLDQMRSLDRFVTGRGDVYRVQVLGYFASGGPVTRLEAMIDATQSPPRIRSVRSLQELGQGYDVNQIGQTSDGF